MTLTLGFSPCPNDTFIFDALVNGAIDTGDFRFLPVLEDVETLNQMAAEARLDITKLSFSALLHHTAVYALLRSGAALGRGAGPLLVAKDRFDLTEISQKRIAIPGIGTTANLLLSLALPAATNKEALLFSQIEEAVLQDRFQAGLIIHESRFTYREKGLQLLLDLGAWWEEATAAPIPLGGIAIQRKLGPEIYHAVNSLLQQSIQHAWERYPSISAYVAHHAQEMDTSVMRQHIQLYVNDFTTNLGQEGSEAIEMLAGKALEAGLVTEKPRFFL